jgi:hypothetical protein
MSLPEKLRSVDNRPKRNRILGGSGGVLSGVSVQAPFSQGTLELKSQALIICVDYVVPTLSPPKPLIATHCDHENASLEYYGCNWLKYLVLKLLDFADG